MSYLGRSIFRLGICGDTIRGIAGAQLMFGNRPHHRSPQTLDRSVLLYAVLGFLHALQRGTHQIN